MCAHLNGISYAPPRNIQHKNPSGKYGTKRRKFHYDGHFPYIKNQGCDQCFEHQGRAFFLAQNIDTAIFIKNTQDCDPKHFKGYFIKNQAYLCVYAQFFIDGYLYTFFLVFPFSLAWNIDIAIFPLFLFSNLGNIAVSKRVGHIDVSNLKQCRCDPCKF